MTVQLCLFHKQVDRVLGNVGQRPPSSSPAHGKALCNDQDDGK